MNYFISQIISLLIFSGLGLLDILGNLVEKENEIKIQIQVFYINQHTDDEELLEEGKFNDHFDAYVSLYKKVIPFFL